MVAKQITVIPLLYVQEIFMTQGDRSKVNKKSPASVEAGQF